MKFREFCRSVVALLLFCCALDSAAAAPADAQKHFLWKVTGDKGVAYLLGTIHFGKADLYPLPAPIEDAFKKSDILIEEVDLSRAQEKERVSELAVARGTYPTGDSVVRHIAVATRQRLLDYVKTNRLNNNYVKYKPWLLSLTIEELAAKKVGLDRAHGLNDHFLHEAGQMDKSVRGLETADSQLEMLTSFNDEQQEQMLLATLIEAAKEPETIKRIIDAWHAGDAPAMNDIVSETVKKFPVLQPYMEKILYKRNDQMTSKIENMLKDSKVYFVAVGAGHLVGERGILAQLRSKNYKIEQL